MTERKTDKIKFFVKRYWLAELVSASASYLFAWLAITISEDKIISSYFGSIGALLGFYIPIYIKDLNKYREYTNLPRKRIYSVVAVGLLVEFGLSEAVDTLVMRPMCLYFAQSAINEFTIAIITGNVIANILFFALSGFMFAKRHAVISTFVKVKNGLNK
jgi:hypothetical protein